MIPDKAIEAAWAESKRRDRSRASISRDEIARMLEAAAPHLLAEAVKAIEDLRIHSSKSSTPHCAEEYNAALANAVDAAHSAGVGE